MMLANCLREARAHPYKLHELQPLTGLESARPKDLAPSLQHTANEGLFSVVAPGQRHDQLVRIVGTLIHKERSPDEIHLLAEGWNARNPARLEEFELYNTVDDLIARYRSSAREPECVSPLFDLNEVRAAALLRTPLLPRRWLLQDCLPLGKVGLIIAPGGTGKSQFALQLAAAVATGTQLAGTWTVPMPGAVVALLAEDDIEEIHRRLDRICNRLVQHDHESLVSLGNNLFIPALAGQNNLITSNDKSSRTVSATGYAERLLLAIRDISDLRLIIIDPVSRFRGGDENSADDATRFVEVCERIAQETGATVLLLHHVHKAAKGNDPDQNHVRGSSALTDGVRWQMNLARLTGRQTSIYPSAKTSPERFLAAHITKNNYGKTSEPVVLHRNDDGYLFAAQASSLSLEDQLLTVIDREAKKGNIFSKNGFEKAFGGKERELNAGIISVRTALKSMLTRGLLVKSGGKIGRASPRAP